MKTSEVATRERRDWTLLIFIIPVGIIFMLIAGQIAIRLVPVWSVNAGMQSNLDPNNLPLQQSGPVQPLLPGILTPLGWFDTFLTPNSDGYDIISDFIILNPATPIPTHIPTNVPGVTKTVVPSTVIVKSTPTIYIPPPVTKKPTDKPTNTPASSAVPTRTYTASPTGVLTATLTATPTSSPTNTLTNTPTATPTSTQTSTQTNTPTNTPTSTPTAIPTGYPSTPPATGYVPPNVVVGNPDGTISNIAPGQFTVIDINASPIIIVGPSETNYDLVYNEAEFNGPGGSGQIYLDSVIVGISMFADGHSYFEVFNWGNGVSDLNTNIWNIVDVDNQIIDMVNLWNYPGTGILVDADNAPSLPPPGSYGYLVVLCPASAPQSLEVDSILTFP